MTVNQYNDKYIFFISHEQSNTGAHIALLHLEYIYKKLNFKTELLTLKEISNIDITCYVKNKSLENKCIPIVICNTLDTYPIVDELSKTNIITYWYIHEWYDNIIFNWFNKYYFYLFNSSVCIIFICVKQYEHYLKLVPYITNYMIMYNGISQDVLNRKINEIPSNIVVKNTDDIIVSIIGMINQRKNQQKFINNVFYRCKNLYPNIKLLLVGDIRSNLYINKNYSNSIIIIGDVNNALPYIVMSDIIVSYSTNEVFPLNIIEAFYCKKPVIATNVGAVSEMIDNNINGYLIKSNDSNDCFYKLCKLIENEPLRKEFGENAYKKCINTYDENITFKQICYNNSESSPK